MSIPVWTAARGDWSACRLVSAIAEPVVTAERTGREDPSARVGRCRTVHDVVTPRLVSELAATLSPHAAPGRSPPPGIFWCLAPDVLPAADLGRDGHPRPGLLLPDTGFSRRMWAGGAITFHGDFSVGDNVEKSTTVTDLTHKTGRSGPLVFLTLRHEYRVAGKLLVKERQDLVYREAGQSVPPTGRPIAGSADPAARVRRLETTPTLLFRYSALTFNGHRIHYDADYAREVEGYGGLVVHGPLLATLMLNLAAEMAGRLPEDFSYRSRAPLLCGTPASLAARQDGADLAVQVEAEGRIVAEARATGAADRLHQRRGDASSGP